VTNTMHFYTTRNERSLDRLSKFYLETQRSEVLKYNRTVEHSSLCVRLIRLFYTLLLRTKTLHCPCGFTSLLSFTGTAKTVGGSLTFFTENLKRKRSCEANKVLWRATRFKNNGSDLWSHRQHYSISQNFCSGSTYLKQNRPRIHMETCLVLCEDCVLRHHSKRPRNGLPQSRLRQARWRCLWLTTLPRLSLSKMRRNSDKRT